ncbi:hypothetical protein Tco_0250193 [Tanacetum coccineum]
MSASTSTPGISSEVAELKEMVKALFLDKKNQSPTPTPVKAVEESCVTCGGAHSYQTCPATSGNVYRDNIQEYVSQAAAANIHSYVKANDAVMRNMQTQDLSFEISFTDVLDAYAKIRLDSKNLNWKQRKVE